MNDINESSSRVVNIDNVTMYNDDCIHVMRNIIPKNSVHLIVTSPQYNVGKEYEEDLSLEEYKKFTREWIGAAIETLVPGGRIAINVANTGRKPYVYLNALIIDICLEFGLIPRQEWIWFKGHSVAAGKTSWGSWCDAKNPITRDCHEYIEMFDKNGESDEMIDPEYIYNALNDDCHEYIEAFSKDSYTMDCEEFKKRPRNKRFGTDFAYASFSVWTIKPSKIRWHPASFPLEIPRRLIKFFTRPGQTVLDPFSGSGSTAVVGGVMGMKTIGIELNKTYFDKSLDRIEMALKRAATSF